MDDSIQSSILQRARTAREVCAGLKPLRLKLQAEVIQHLRKWYSEENLEAILQALGTPPRQTTIRVNTLRITREDLLAKLESHCKTVC